MFSTAEPIAGSPDTEPTSGVRRCPTLQEKMEMGQFARDYSERGHAWLFAARVPLHDAEEVVQTALAALWEHWDEVAEAARPRWFWRAVLNRDNERRRKWGVSHKYAERVGCEMELQVFSPAPTPEEQLLEGEVVAAMRWHFARLPTEQQAVVALYIFEEVPMAEAAIRLGIKEDTAKKRWRLAKEALRAGVQREEAKERFKIAAVVAVTIAALFALWRRGWARARRGAGPLFACASLPLMVASHDPLRFTDAARTLDERTVRAETIVLSPYAFLPAFSAFAERELDAPWARSGPAKAAKATVSSARLEAARSYLVRVNTALYREKDRTKARRFLHLYEAAFPEKPFPEHYAGLVADLRGP